jgi:hypothetical protein
MVGSVDGCFQIDAIYGQAPCKGPRAAAVPRRRLRFTPTAHPKKAEGRRRASLRPGYIWARPYADGPSAALLWTRSGCGAAVRWVRSLSVQPLGFQSTILRETGGPVVRRPRQACWINPWSPVLSGSAALRPCGPPAGPPMAARPFGRWSRRCWTQANACW